MPVYNEKPQAVFANLAAMAEELAATGQGRAFDVFVLSDTTNPQRWVEEEQVWLAAKRLFPKEINLYYRRRPPRVSAVRDAEGRVTLLPVQDTFST